MEKIESYYNLLPQWLNYYGFEEIKVHEGAGPDKVFRRARVEAAKFGKVDCYICAKYFKTMNRIRSLPALFVPALLVGGSGLFTFESSKGLELHYTIKPLSDAAIRYWRASQMMHMPTSI